MEGMPENINMDVGGVGGGPIGLDLFYFFSEILKIKLFFCLIVLLDFKKFRGGWWSNVFLKIFELFLGYILWILDLGFSFQVDGGGWLLDVVW